MERGERSIALAAVLLAVVALIWLATRPERDPAVVAEPSALRTVATEELEPGGRPQQGNDGSHAHSTPASLPQRDLLESGPGSAVVLGTVVDPEGAPISGASVTLFDGPLFGSRGPETPSVAREALTDESGVFRFALAAEGLFGVRVSAPSFVPKGRNQSTGVDVPFELLRGGSWVGRLRGPQPERFQVLHAGTEALRGERWIRVDDGSGAFALEDAPVGRPLELQVVPERGLPFAAYFVLPGPGEHTHDIDVGTAPALEGVIVDALTRAPIADAMLLGFGPDEARVLARSDGRGRFRCELFGEEGHALARGETQRLISFVRLRAAGYLDTLVWLGMLASGQPLQLVPGGRVEGRVLDAEGRPVPQADVEWLGARRLLDARFGELELDPAALRCTTDDDGHFALEPVFWGIEAALAARANGRVGWFLDAAPERPRAARSLELRLPRGRALCGHVRWALPLGKRDLSASLSGVAELPAPRVTVVLADPQGDELARAATGADGGFCFAEIPAGPLFLAIDGNVGPPIALEPESAEPVTLIQDPPMLELQGSLSSSSGEPLVRQDVHARLRLGALGEAGPALFGARTDSEGAFALHVPDFAHCPVVLMTTVGLTRFEREAAGARIDWTLPELVPVELLLADGDELRRRIAWQGPAPDEGGGHGRIETPVGGRITLELPRGSLLLELSHAGGESGNARRERVDVTRAPGGTAFRIDLSR